MQIFREGVSPILDSPARQLYGQKKISGKTLLIAPLDIILWEVDSNGTPILNPPNTPGNFISSVVRTSGKLVGKIKSYNFPPPLPSSNIKPVVWIDPSPGLNLTDIPDVNTFWNPSLDPPLVTSQQVTLVLDSGTVTGKLVSNTEIVISYFGDSQVSAYQVEFDDQNLLEQVHGARVLVGNTLLGMLFADNLVFPAYRI